MSEPCNCITDFNEKLAPEHELEISIAFTRGENAMMYGTTITKLLRKDNGKPERRSGKPGFAAHSYCPFCGIKKP